MCVKAVGKSCNEMVDRVRCVDHDFSMTEKPGETRKPKIGSCVHEIVGFYVTFNEYLCLWCRYCEALKRCGIGREYVQRKKWCK
jgi:hypothetical protein